MAVIEKNGIVFETRGLPLATAEMLLVWGHGWGHNRTAFNTLIQPLLQRAAHIVLDFPGFGESPLPETVWGTEDYADAIAALIAEYRTTKKIVWIGHSFGGRVGIRLAARHPVLIDGLFLIASAGLPRQRKGKERLRYESRRLLFKAIKWLAPTLKLNLDKWRAKFSSADYLAAGKRRPIFVKTISENLAEDAARITCPTALIYGENDKEASPDIGARLSKLIKNATFEILPRQDHYSVLAEGSSLVVKRLIAFLDNLK